MSRQSVYLVAYFSPGGTTRPIAQYLAQGVLANLLEIVPKEPYTERDLNWRRFFSRCNREHRRNTLPRIEAPEYDLSKYSVVFLGFPIWYDKAPNIIKSFLRLNNWTNQKIVLFATSGGSGIENSASDLRRFLGKDVIAASHLFDPGAEMEEIGSWGNSVLQSLYEENKKGAQTYIDNHYVEPVPPPVVVKEEETDYNKKQDVRFSSVLSGVKFSIDLTDPEAEKRKEEQRKKNQALLDRYNRAGIRSTMQSMPTRSGSGVSRGAVLRALENYTDQSFVGKLMQLIREKGLSEPAVYRAAQIDRKLFSKIISNQEYKPSKDTCVALAYALRLDLQAANDLLSRAGYTFSHSNKRDVILEYFFSVGEYNIYEINDVLFQLFQNPLGRMA